MKRYLFCCVFAFFVFITSANATEVLKNQVIENFGKIPLSFTANEGQFNPQVKFRSSINGAVMFFTQEGTTFLFSRKVQKSLTERMIMALKQSIRNLFSLEPYESFREEDLQRDWEYYALKLHFVNANPNPEVVGEEMLAWNTNYFIGNNPEKWRTDIPNYGKVRLRNLYPGIDLVYYGNKQSVKYDFVVQPGADPGQILLAYDFDSHSGGFVSINERGELVVKTAFGDLIERKPYAFQIIDGEKVKVTANYTIIKNSENSYTFSLLEYNSEFPLIIDPALMYSTFLGGSGSDYGNSIALDGSGNAYMTGRTQSSNFPTTPGVYDTSYNNSGNWDAFVVKLNSTGSSLLYSTFLGGSTIEYGNDITLDGSGNTYVTGYTSSSDFPATPGAYDRSFHGICDVFVTKLNSTGSSLLYSTFCGGSGWDIGNSIALDESGNVCVTGSTISSGFPTTQGAYDTSFNGVCDVFLFKLNSTGSSLLYSTFCGGSDYDEGYSIALDESENAFVTGYTRSTNFPTTPGAYDTSFNGIDVFVAKLNSTGSLLIYSTFLGSGEGEYGNSIALDGSGNAYVTGFTGSSNFPTTPGAYDTSFNGNCDVFVTKLNSSGSSLLYSTFLGGGNIDYGNKIALDGSGNAYVTGFTVSSDFPTTPDAYDTSYNGGEDVFITKLNSSGSALLYSTFVGGSSTDQGQSIAIDGGENAYITGSTNSVSFPSSPGAYDQNHNGGRDVFITKFLFEQPSAYDSLLVYIPDTLLVGQNTFPGDTVIIPVYLNPIEYNQHNGIYSFQTELTYNDSLFQCIGYDSSGTVLSNRGGLSEFTVKFRKDSGRGASLDTLRIAGASDDSLYYPEVPGTPFAFPRPLIKLKFRIPTTAHNGDSTILHFARFMFNEGIPASSTDDGSIKLRLRKKGDVDKNGVIQPIDAILVLRYVIHDTTLDAESQEAAEVSGNGQVTAYDASLILQYFVGKITSFPAGTYYKQALPSNKSADIAMEWGEVKEGMISLIVKAKNLTEVYGYSLVLSYDPGILTYQGYQSSDWTKSRTAVVRNENGQLRMAVAGVDPLDGDGEIVSFKFKINSNGDFNHDKLVNLNELVLNEEIIISNATMSSLPKTYSLEQNYPNPFNPETRIRYQILDARNVQLIVYNLLGQPVRTLVNEMKPAGVYEVRWDGKNDQGINLASGVYIYRIKAGNFMSTRKLILMK